MGADDDSQGAPSQTPIKVAIFVDSSQASKRRYCYWLAYFDYAGITPDLVSVPDLKDRLALSTERSLPRLDQHDLIIFNWDVVNGDYAFRADESLEFIQNRGREEIKRWAHRGARIIVEIQSAGGKPLQQVYDAVAGAGEVTVNPPSIGEPDDEAETTLVRNRQRVPHPIVRELARPDEIIRTKYRPFSHKPLLNLNEGHQSTYERRPEVLSWGHFNSWRQGWAPLLFRPGRYRRRPVALSRAYGDKGGEVILTTMRMANSGNYDLLDSFCRVSRSSRMATQDFFRRAGRARVAARSCAIGLIWLLGILIMIPAAQYFASLIDQSARGWFRHILEVSDLPRWTEVLLAWLSVNLKIVDVTAYTVVVGLLAASRWLWLRREGV